MVNFILCKSIAGGLAVSMLVSELNVELSSCFYHLLIPQYCTLKFNKQENQKN